MNAVAGEPNEDLPVRGDHLSVAGLRARSDFRVALHEILPLQPDGADQPVDLAVHGLTTGVVASTPYLRQVFDTEASTVNLFEQLVLLDGQPLYLNCSYTPQSFDLAELTAAMEAIHRSGCVPPVREVFTLLFGREYGGGTAVVAAVESDRNTARHLGVADGAPVLMREMVLYDAAGQATNLLWTHYRSDRTETGTL